MISVVIPAYNVKDFLSKCVESVLGSTCQDFELILVDDGSTDGTAEICDRYAAQDDRIQVIHQPNRGLSEARNAGLKVVKGEYLLFIDADDVIHYRMMEVLLDAIKSGEYDYSMVHGVKIPIDKFDPSLRTCDVDLSKRETVSRQTYLSRMYYHDYQYHVMWNKLFRSSLVKDLKFRHTTAEDTEWINRMVVKSNMGIVIDAPMYFYMIRPGSIMSDGADKRKVRAMFSYLVCLDSIPKEDIELRSICLRSTYSYMLFVRKCCRGTEFENEANAGCAEIYKKTIAEFKHSDNSFFIKVRYILFYHFPWLYNFIFKLMGY